MVSVLTPFLVLDCTTLMFSVVPRTLETQAGLGLDWKQFKSKVPTKSPQLNWRLIIEALVVNE